MKLYIWLWDNDWGEYKDEPQEIECDGLEIKTYWDSGDEYFYYKGEERITIWLNYPDMIQVGRKVKPI